MKSYGTTLIIALVVGILGFLGGIQFQQYQSQKQRQNFLGQLQGNGGFRQQGMMGAGARGMGNRNGFRPVAGEVIGSDASSITVKLPDGSSKIVLLTNTTEINKADQAKREDVTIGERIAVFGQENADGSITAVSIQLNPTIRGLVPESTGSGT